jgi:cytoskeletal protein CcmA (bactofilin family)
MSISGNGRSSAPIKKTIVDQGTSFKGSMTSSCPIVVMGRIEGEVTGPAVEVTETGALAGKAKLSELRSRGELAGDFEADEVELAGKVKDSTVIRAKSLLVAAGRPDGELMAVFGDCEIQVGDAPSKADAVAEAMGIKKPAPPAPPEATATQESPAAAPAPSAPTEVPLSNASADEPREDSADNAPATENGPHQQGGRRSKKSAAERSNELP